MRAYSNLALALCQRGAASSTVELRRGALRAARSLKCDARSRIREIWEAHLALIMLLDELGEGAAAREAEVDAVDDLRAFRRSLQLH